MRLLLERSIQRQVQVVALRREPFQGLQRLPEGVAPGVAEQDIVPGGLQARGAVEPRREVARHIRRVWREVLARVDAVPGH